ncbi:bifunctional aminopeptidase/epoxide hydrolase Ecym_3306 [Eremothecium cymbalariae DBVPG|uniref:Leucine aminopeptidase 2 n=1 Tax=Eremothecium cymbalariae (strain CBS 270.75 / DBVPG 7215 / KCTC 17166 / NRRL Y-17582) TaxID=931890 RepID=G8JRM8_ERECY|nr:Hypothetical protein Ecym_3306 [Eremothecium cymbalariae DBVPG\
MTLPQALEARRPAVCPEPDISTLSNYESFDIKHTQLALEISFDRKVVTGTVIYSLDNVGKAKRVRLDTMNLVITQVYIDDSIVKFNLFPTKYSLGTLLEIIPHIKLPKSFKLKCEFATKPESQGLQWMNELQTFGRPFVYTLMHTIYARSIIPSFDTPAIKSTFSVTIKSPLPVVFSGTELRDSGRNKVYRFVQKVPIPVYMLGFASGDLMSAQVGLRSKVYTESSRIKEAWSEFKGNVEPYIKIAEGLVSEYEWGNYNILINPDAYPYGGMEYPGITFTSPTVIAHDNSNHETLIRELTHSWSGSLVTNASWGHFWLNEGWAVYLERRIIEIIHGEPVRHLSALIGLIELEYEIAYILPEQSTALVQKITKDMNPEDLITCVPYEKGFNFLFYLENVLGGKEFFDPFIKYYFVKFAHQSVDTWLFLDTLFEFFSDKKDILNHIDWETWLFGDGMPPRQDYITILADVVYQLADRWIAKAIQFTSFIEFTKEFSPADITQFNTNQLILFLNVITTCGSYCKDLCFKWSAYPVAANALLKIYDILTNSTNSEVICRVLYFKLIANLDSSCQQTIEWLGKVARLKYVRPLYCALYLYIYISICIY